ncbi:hypothetical protein WG906_17965 [Pedobacter sp. P351]|uniref:hypothetical protein n=1 Tax=Pedobacter superstes TaxID=3133441 RepID=UPI0030B4DE24
MITKEYEMFYFDDKTFITLCKQIEREIKAMPGHTNDNINDLRLAYQKFELFLTVYYQSCKREDIDYKTDLRLEIVSDINQMSEQDETGEITKDFYTEHFLNAKDKLGRVIEDIIYQITIHNLARKPAD